MAAPLVEQLHLLNRRSEGRQDHHVTGGHPGEILHSLLDGDELHIHLTQMIIHGGVVDDLVGDPQAFLRVVTPRLISHGDGSLHAPAETEGFGQTHGEPPVGQSVAVIPDRSDQAALIGLFQTLGDLFGSSEATPVVALGVVK